MSDILTPAIDRSVVPPVPDAADPWLATVDCTETNHRIGSRVTTHRLRRAQVLAAVRRRIASEGHRGVTLGMIASDCGTTVQTVFNLAGNKSELLKAAIAEHGLSLNITAFNWKNYPLLALGFADAIWASAQCNPDFLKESALAVDNMYRSSGTAARSSGARLVALVLGDIREDLRETYSVTSIARILSSLIAVTMLEWAQDGLGPNQLRAELINRVALVLIGAVQPEKGAQIEAWLTQGAKN